MISIVSVLTVFPPFTEQGNRDPATIALADLYEPTRYATGKYQPTQTPSGSYDTVEETTGKFS